MGLLFWRKPRVIHVTERERDLILMAQLEATGNPVDEIESNDNMPATVLNMSLAKQDGKGLRNAISQSNGFETNLIDEINQRFGDTKSSRK
jgi:hypothetical protein